MTEALGGDPLGGGALVMGKDYGTARIEHVQVFEAITGSGSVTARKTGMAIIYAWGAGGSGTSNGGGEPGGQGGAGVSKSIRIARGQTITYSVGAGGASKAAGTGMPGNAGGATTVTLPNGAVLTAGGGPGGNSPVADVATATGGDINRPGNAPLSFAEGGNSASFADIGYLPGIGSAAQTGVGVSSATGGNPGGGGGGSSTGSTGAGASGKVLILFVRAY